MIFVIKIVKLVIWGILHIMIILSSVFLLHLYLCLCVCVLVVLPSLANKLLHNTLRRASLLSRARSDGGHSNKRSAAYVWTIEILIKFLSWCERTLWHYHLQVIIIIIIIVIIYFALKCKDDRNKMYAQNDQDGQAVNRLTLKPPNIEFDRQTPVSMVSCSTHV